MKLRLVWLWVPVVLWAGVIFYFSSYSDPVYSPVVSEIGQEVETIDIPDVSIRPYLPQFTLKQISTLANSSELVRRAMHLTLYLILGILLARALMNTMVQHAVWWAMGSASLYALSDEFHQRFVPRRTFQWLDIAFDVLGAVLGILLYRWVKSHKQQRNLNKTT